MSDTEEFILPQHESIHWASHILYVQREGAAPDAGVYGDTADAGWLQEESAPDRIRLLRGHDSTPGTYES